ncbi:MAG: TylF/MycF/NovP-related O-methyltransferase [Bryobacteraceae bacterium]|jgi:hypothetical protein
MHPPELNAFRSFCASIVVSDQFELDKARLLRSGRSYTTHHWRNLSTIYDAAWRIECERIPGHVVERGVSNGGSCAVLCAALDSNATRHLRMFDCWEAPHAKHAARSGNCCPVDARKNSLKMDAAAALLLRKSFALPPTVVV